MAFPKRNFKHVVSKENLVVYYNLKCAYFLLWAHISCLILYCYQLTTRTHELGVSLIALVSLLSFFLSFFFVVVVVVVVSKICH